MKPLLISLFPLFATQALAQENGQSYTLRAGTLIKKEQSFVMVGVGVQLKTTDTWNIEASADLALSNGLNLPTEENGLFGAFPLSLSGVYHPLSELKLSPFVEVGGGVNIITENDPNPFLHGGAGASYKGSDWALNTDVRFLFLPGDKETPIEDPGLQMTLALQRDF